MKKIQLLKQIQEQGVVAVLRADDHEQVIEMAEEAIRGGIKVIEITMTVPKALRAIEELAARYSSEPNADKPFAIIGAGTVLDAATARACILAGAEFVVGPSLQEDTVKLCNRYRVPIMPGVMTIADAQTALELGVDIVKLFPGNLYDPSIIKTIKGPLPQVNIMPTGGVNVDNLADWIKAGAVAVGIGSDLTKEAVATGDMSCVRKQAERYMAAYQEAVGASAKEGAAISS
ncbi:bifunctional 2-keto-4-hydroxyglutarate aldolase/2-keto-3-deoxy-6-phosphogluconate aldolase [Paenibacillus sp. 1001270B_150601_E10]|uniref:bifunctional 2-keto-4-hydroxyglutarate aldolase/2-keto-3-deoxy-6-phosphogluconate aldolase n=1 Tax=Paenibacillus sp. 1001270B_150601_E10 TaxID=2787079 RepID=UPI00189E6F60|nr:bifunctional 2-keto-4-hydroxyglutarate aldolase/2-keto-3-deoxy-6-phosphogluconate aldolase [Paenibacillus sp. 1001270B_150601_E10]